MRSLGWLYSNMRGLNFIKILLFFFWFVSTSDCRHLNSREVDNFPFSQGHDNLFTSEMSELCDKLMNDFEKNKYRENTSYKATGQVIYDEN